MIRAGIGLLAIACALLALHELPDAPAERVITRQDTLQRSVRAYCGHQPDESACLRDQFMAAETLSPLIEAMPTINATSIGQRVVLCMDKNFYPAAGGWDLVAVQDCVQQRAAVASR